MAILIVLEALCNYTVVVVGFCKEAMCFKSKLGYCVTWSNESLVSWPQSILVVVRRHCALQDNLDRIGRPRYKNLKIKKEEGKGRTLYKYM